MQAKRPTAGLLLALLAAAAAAACRAGNDPTPRPPSYRAEFEAIATSLEASENRYVGTLQLPRLEEQLRRTDLAPADRAQAMIDLSFAYLRLGNPDGGVAQIEEALDLVRGSNVDSKIVAEVLFGRGMAYLRKAEVQNCILKHNRDCCIFPLAGGGVHNVPEPALRARESFTEYLRLRPRDLRAAWLLNVIAMASGDHPLSIPAEYRIAPEAFRSDFDIGRFPDVAPRVGLDTFNQAGGVVADDIDGDGLIDIVTSTFNPSTSLSYKRNLGGGRFEDRTAASRLDDQLGGLNLIGGDYDGDGDLDLLVLRGAWMFEDGRIRKSLLRNEADGTFTDVSRESGIAEASRPTQAAVWADFDNDGDLDLYVAHESPAEAPPMFPAQLFQNRGDGTFAEIAAEAGVTNDSYGKGVSAGDYDNDADLDLYVSNIGPNRLYRNDGNMRFVDVAPEVGVTEPAGRSFAPWFFDYDNDGWLDLWVGAYDAKVDDIYLDMLGKPHGASPPCLYHNNGDGTFTDVAEEVGLGHAWLPMGANFGDADNDGWLDIYLGTGDPHYFTIVPNVMLRNDGARRFQNVTTSMGTGHLQKGHGVAFVDLDNDGDQDLFHQLGGFFPGDGFQNALFANPGHGRHWLTVELRGAGRNTRAIGARLKVVLKTPAGERELHRAVGSVSSFGGSPFRQEIGCADAEAVLEVEIVWPASGGRQILRDVPLDATIRVVQGRDGFERLHPPQFDLLRAN